MKQKQLEMFLQHIPSHPAPSAALEQYQTPAPIAADILYTAYQWKDIYQRNVADYGCGTGIFALGAALLGASHVLAVDIDAIALGVAESYAYKNDLQIEILQSPISQVTSRSDTVLMNPPFGAQLSSRNSDRIFLAQAMKNSPVTYSLHLKKTSDFIEKLIERLGGNITFEKDYQFPLKHQFWFHEKRVVNISARLYRIINRACHKNKC